MMNLEHFAHTYSRWAGSGKGFLVAIISVIIWFVIGYFKDFSLEWESHFVAFMAIVTFLMVFLIQRVQNKELQALHVKLNELVSSSKEADNAVIAIEKCSEDIILNAHNSYDPVSEN